MVCVVSCPSYHSVFSSGSMCQSGLCLPLFILFKRGVVGDPIGSIFKSHMGYWEPLVGL